MGKRTKETITLGSGKLFILKFTGEIPEDSEIEQESNIAGYIQGGASISYSPEHYTAEDDLGYVKKTIITKEEAKLTSGIMTWNADTLKQLCATGRVSEDKQKGLRTIKIEIINLNIKFLFILKLNINIKNLTS